MIHFSKSLYLRTIFLLALSFAGVTVPVRADPPGNMPVLTIAGIEQFIDTHAITSIDALLADLPASYLDQYTLVFQSRSLQGASFAHPRALVHGSSGRLIMSFNGDDAQAGYNALELLEFNATTHAFQMAEIEFPPAGKDHDSAADTTRVRFSRINPDKCVRCHGDPPRPLWDSPPLWPGSYGESYRKKLTAAEMEGLTAYLQLQPTHPRYRYLHNTRRYQNESAFYASRQELYEGVESESPNGRLSRMLTALNNERIMQNVLDSPHFTPLRYALLASLSNSCHALPNTLPPVWNTSDFAQFAAQDRASLTRQQSRKAARSLAGAIAPGEVSEDNTLGEFRYLAERGLGLATSQWSMTLEQDVPDFTSLAPIRSMLEKKLVAQISATDPLLMGEYYYRDYPGHNRYCNYLESRSRQQVEQADLQPLPTRQRPVTAQPAAVMETMQLCVACHATGAAPYIEFDNLPALAARLNRPFPRHGTLLGEIQFRLSEAAGAQRMPPTLNLTEADTRAFETFLQQLAAP